MSGVDTQYPGASRRKAGYPASANLDILIPRLPARRPLGPARLILRSPRIQVWLKDENLEDSTNLLGLEIQVARFP